MAVSAPQLDGSADEAVRPVAEVHVQNALTPMAVVLEW